MAAGVVLFSLEMAHPELPFWADLFFTLGVVVYLNALGAAYDFFILLEERSKKD